MYAGAAQMFYMNVACLEVAATKHGEGTRLLTGREDATGAA